MSRRQSIPELTKRIVRREACFGCVICGNPLIVYAHIISYEISHDNSPSNLVTLCPTCHTKYDLGAISENQIRNFKSNPFNRGRDVKDTFNIIGEVPIIEAGTSTFKNTSVLLFVDDKNIVTLTKEENELLLNALFYDEKNKLLAYIKDNEWCSLSGMVWDIDYHTVAKALILRTKSRKILLKLRIAKGIIHFSGLLYYNGVKAKISPSEIVFATHGRADVRVHWKGLLFENCITAIAFDTQKGTFEIGTSIHVHQYSKPIYAILRQRTNLLWRPIYETLFVMRRCRLCNKISI